MSGLRDGMTCREVEARLLSRGFERTGTGKGSHRRYARGPDRVTLPYKRGHDRVSRLVIRDVARGAGVRLGRGGVAMSREVIGWRGRGERTSRRRTRLPLTKRLSA